MALKDHSLFRPAVVVVSAEVLVAVVRRSEIVGAAVGVGPLPGAG